VSLDTVSDFFDDDDYIPPKVEVEEVEEKEEAKKHTMFQIMSTIVNKKFMPTDEEIETLNSFLMVRYISNDGYAINIANVINSYHKMPLKAQYLYARYSIGNKINYINFPKKEELPNKEEVEIFQNHFKCNENIAVDYIQRMPAEEKKLIIDKYTNIGKVAKTKKPRKKSK
jgi:hypothetical protein